MSKPISIYQLLNVFCEETGKILIPHKMESFYSPNICKKIRKTATKPTYTLLHTDDNTIILATNLNDRNRIITEIDMHFNPETNRVDFTVNKYKLNIIPNIKDIAYLHATSQAEDIIRTMDFPIYDDDRKDNWHVSISDNLFHKIEKYANFKLQQLHKELNREMRAEYKDIIEIGDLAKKIYKHTNTLILIQQESIQREQNKRRMKNNHEN